MTLQQEAYRLICALPDESVRDLVKQLRSISPSPLHTAETGSAVRFGLGKGVITDPAEFDRWDGELAAMFEESPI